jgi:RHS repeat-associated protein
VTTEYDYNLQNRMSAATVTATSETTQTVSNKYNAKGQRIKKLENGGTTNYYYVGDAVLFTTTQNAHMLTENILDPDGTIVASKRFPDDVPSTPDSFADEYCFYNYDIRGSVTSIIAPHDMTLPGGTTLQGGSPVAGYEYDEYGNLEENGTQGFLNETTYTGSVTDKSTGLQYMSARYYDAENGRFLTQDTYTGNPYDPWTQHLYAYCGNNPVSMVDPTGHFVIPIIGLVISFWDLLFCGGVAIAGGMATKAIIDHTSSRTHSSSGSKAIPRPSQPPTTKSSSRTHSSASDGIAAPVAGPAPIAQPKATPKTTTGTAITDVAVTESGAC